jgi:ribosomal protein S18 acetylase RimI-like enzyme
MTGYKLLIDTNIFIGLEDPKLIDPVYAEFQRNCVRNGIRLFVHEAALDDIGRDKDQNRRQISLSKLDKFERISGIKLPDRTALEAIFGPIHRPNDEVDVALLYALERGVIDFLVTQDQGIHDRVKLSPLSKRVFRLSDALSWLRQNFEPNKVKLPFVAEKKAHEIDSSDAIFDSLRDGYDNFDGWWQEKCVREHRPCWTVELGKELAGIVVRKDETRSAATVTLPGDKVLKLCTFKVKPKFRGEKLGELLLKQALWFAQRNSYELVYLTTQPDQTYLIQILEYYGFRHTATLAKDECVFEKPMSSCRLLAEAATDIFELDRLNYPRFVADEHVEAYCVPIKGEFHRKLFPEIALQPPLPLFPGLSTFQAGPSDIRIPGNTIRKVYLCRAQARQLRPGDLLFFYESKTPGFSASQSVTSVGVLEAANSTLDIDELIQLTAKRSVYSQSELKAMILQSEAPVKVLDFLLVGHFEPPVPLSRLLELGIFNRHPPQSISRLDAAQVATLKVYLNLGFEL